MSKQISLGRDRVLTAAQAEMHIAEQSRRWDAIRIALRCGDLVYDWQTRRYVPRS